VSVAVGVGVAVAVGVAVGAGVGTTLANSKAPISHELPPRPGLVTRRWSVMGHCATGIASIAGLVACNAIVSVGPPLFCRPSWSNSGVTLSPIVWPLAPVPL